MQQECILFHFADIRAFRPADKIQHSPAAACLSSSDADVPAVSSSSSVPHVTAAAAAAAATAGPLSSTLIDASDDSLTDADTVDTVAMKLFAHGLLPCNHITIL